jgi:hypothetical protein
VALEAVLGEYRTDVCLEDFQSSRHFGGVVALDARNWWSRELSPCAGRR